MKCLITIAQRAIMDQFIKQPKLSGYSKIQIKKDLSYWPYWEKEKEEPENIFLGLEQSDLFDWLTSRTYFHPGFDRITIQGKLLEGKLVAYVTINIKEGALVEHVEICKIGV